MPEQVAVSRIDNAEELLQCLNGQSGNRPLTLSRSDRTEIRPKSMGLAQFNLDGMFPELSGVLATPSCPGDQPACEHSDRARTSHRKSLTSRALATAYSAIWSKRRET